MKIGELKHNHSLTDLLKVLLFALLMLAPIGNVLTRSLYVICNKNAYQSYSSNIIEEVSQINNTTFVADTLYTYQYSQPQTTNGIRTPFSYVSLTANDLNLSQANYDSLTHVYLTSDNKIYFSNTNNSNRWSYELTDTMFQSFAMRTSYQNGLTDTFKVMLATYTEQKLDNVFEYSVSKLATDQMFTWTANTPVFTGIQAMCAQLGITAPAIPIIIAYWLILTCVYIVIDIVIKLITYITHLIGARKGA